MYFSSPTVDLMLDSFCHSETKDSETILPHAVDNRALEQIFHVIGDFWDRIWH